MPQKQDIGGEEDTDKDRTMINSKYIASIPHSLFKGHLQRWIKIHLLFQIQDKKICNKADINHVEGCKRL